MCLCLGSDNGGFTRQVGKQGWDLDLQRKTEGKTTLRASLKMLPAFISTILKMQMKLSDLQRDQKFFLMPLEFIHFPSTGISFRSKDATKKAWGHQEHGAEGAHPHRAAGTSPQAYFRDVMQKPGNTFD